MIFFLLKASLILAVLWLFYRLFLEKESFFAANRIYLLGSILMVFILPFISLPELVKEQGLLTRMLERSPAIIANEPAYFPVQEETVSNSPVDHSYKRNSEQIAPRRTHSWSLLDWTWAIYLFGVGVFVLRLGSQLFLILARIVACPDQVQSVGYTIINSPDIKEPCSFFRYLFINPEQYEYETYEQILSHEEIHIRKFHSLDLLVAEIMTIFLWFFPLSWLMRKEVEKNLEYQTDELLLRERIVERSLYQMNLLKVATYRKPLTITTNYNQSLLKKRIHKMSAKKSNSHSYWKYAFVAPVLFSLAVLLNKPVVSFAQMKKQSIADEFMGDDDYPQTEQSMEARITEDISIEEEVEIQTDLELEEEEVVDISSPVEKEIKLRNGLTKEDKAMIKAAKAGDLRRLRSLLASGAYIDANQYGIGTALIVAARAGELEVVKYLSNEGANLDIDSYGVGTAVIAACRSGQLTTLKYLISSGANLDVNSYGVGTALMVALKKGDRETARYLLAEGANPDVDSYGIGTPLIVAAKSSNWNNAKYLISRGADLNINSYGVGTALIASIRNGNWEMAEFLIREGADLNVDSYGIGTALIVAVKLKDFEGVRYLLSEGAEVDANSYGVGSALLIAASQGNRAIVRELLRAGAEVNASSYGVGTPLIAAVINGHIEVARLLLEEGADPYQSPHGLNHAVAYAHQSDNSEIKNLFKEYQKEYQREY